MCAHIYESVSESLGRNVPAYCILTGNLIQPKRFFSSEKEHILMSKTMMIINHWIIRGFAPD